MVTMGCGEECPYMPGAVVDWRLDDPKGEPIKRVREIRNEIEKRVAELIDEHGWRRNPE
jgi:arsenate reductase